MVLPVFPAPIVFLNFAITYSFNFLGIGPIGEPDSIMFESNISVYFLPLRAWDFLASPDFARLVLFLGLSCELFNVPPISNFEFPLLDFQSYIQLSLIAACVARYRVLHVYLNFSLKRLSFYSVKRT